MKISSKSKKYFIKCGLLKFVGFAFFMLLLPDGLTYGQTVAREECTIGVASGSATADGRPLLWKTRDYSSAPDNKVRYNTSHKYKFLSVTNADSDLAWMGTNEQGFAIVNSLSRDLNSGLSGPGNGTLMRDALGACKSVVDFQDYLDSTNVSGRRTQANFGVIDSSGAAAIFETGGNFYYKFDAKTAEHGYVIRTNFSESGGGSGGIERYKRSVVLIDDFHRGDTLHYKSLLRHQMRDFSDENSHAVSVPYPDSWPGGAPYGYINCEKSICRSSSVSAAVIHGILPGEHPGLTTMWVMLGQPATTISLPYWPVGETPVEAGGYATSQLCDEARSIKRLVFDYSGSNHFIDSYKLRDSDGNGLWSCLFPLEDSVFSRTKRYMDSLRLLSSLPVHSILDTEGVNAAEALSHLQECRRSIAVDVNAVDSKELISFYPNPADNKIYIDGCEESDIEVQIYDMNGRLLLHKILGERREVAVEFLASGMYIIQITANQKIHQLKLMKE
ncbi:MAG: T9SS type A sorting domain-containing protein [Bacteroidales bacterium]